MSTNNNNNNNKGVSGGEDFNNISSPLEEYQSTLHTGYASEDFNNISGSINDKIDREFEKAIKKPVFLLIGESGVGKSSIAKQIIKKISIENLEKMNINSETNGTSETVFIEEDNITIIDCRGKSKTENSKEYFQYLSSFTNVAISTIDYLIGVISAVGNRDDDIDSISDTIKSITKHYNIPYLILLNKYDMVSSAFDTIEQFNSRYDKCVAKFCNTTLIEKYLRYFNFEKNLCIGVFKVSANPLQTLKLECPDDKSIKAKEKHGCCTIADNKGLYCQKCNKYWFIPNVDIEDPQYIEAIQDENALYEMVENQSIGFKPNDEVMKSILDTCVSNKIYCQIAKSISSDLNQKYCTIAGMVKIQYFADDWKHHDSELNRNIAWLFGLKLSSTTQPYIELRRWKDIDLLLNGVQRILIPITAPLNRFVCDPSSELLGAWALFYGLKYKSISIELTDFLSKKRPIINKMKDQLPSTSSSPVEDFHSSTPGNEEVVGQDIQNVATLTSKSTKTITKIDIETISKELREIAKCTIKVFDDIESDIIPLIQERIKSTSLENVCKELSTFDNKCLGVTAFSLELTLSNLFKNKPVTNKNGKLEFIKSSLRTIQNNIIINKKDEDSSFYSPQLSQRVQLLFIINVIDVGSNNVSAFVITGKLSCVGPNGKPIECLGIGKITEVK